MSGSMFIQKMFQNLLTDMAIEELNPIRNLPNEIEDMSWEAAKKARTYWEQQAGQMLSTQRLPYQQAISVYEDYGEGGGVVVGLSTENKLLLAIEEGAPSFDMKPGLLAGRESRVIPIGPPGQMRTVTTRQPAHMWVHPGFDGLRLAEDVDQYLDDVILPELLDEFMSRV
jgi:hypothetical protein